jgi:hypothetical protein
MSETSVSILSEDLPPRKVEAGGLSTARRAVLNTFQGTNPQKWMMGNLKLKYGPAKQDRAIELILNNKRSRELIQWQEVKSYSEKCENFKKEYKGKILKKKIRFFANFYRYHYEIPRNFMEEFMVVLDKFHDRKREEIFKRVCKEIGKKNIVGCEDEEETSCKQKKQFPNLLDSLMDEFKNEELKSSKMQTKKFIKSKGKKKLSKIFLKEKKSKKGRRNKIVLEENSEQLIQNLLEDIGYNPKDIQKKSRAIMLNPITKMLRSSKVNKKVMKYGARGVIVNEDDDLLDVTPIQVSTIDTDNSRSSPPIAKQILAKTQRKLTQSVGNFSKGFRLKTLNSLKNENYELRKKKPRNGLKDKIFKSVIGSDKVIKKSSQGYMRHSSSTFNFNNSKEMPAKTARNAKKSIFNSSKKSIPELGPLKIKSPKFQKRKYKSGQSIFKIQNNLAARHNRGSSIKVKSSRQQKAEQTQLSGRGRHTSRPVVKSGVIDIGNIQKRERSNLTIFGSRKNGTHRMSKKNSKSQANLNGKLKIPLLNNSRRTGSLVKKGGKKPGFAIPVEIKASISKMLKSQRMF